MYPRTHGRFPTLMNRPTSHPEQQLLLVRVSDSNNDENTKLIVSSFHRHHEDANNNSTASPSSSDIQIFISTLNITLEEIVKYFDEHLNTSYIFTRGPEPIRQHLIPLFVQNEHFVPHQLLDYFDINVIMEISEVNEEDDIATARFILNLKNDEVERTHRVVNIEYKSAPIVVEDSTGSDGDNLICRARGLPWQASDQHVAQFFAGLDIVPGGIALCLSSEGRRNGEALVQFVNQESRDLALKRHRNFLLSRYIEVYKATMDEFLHVASGSSTEAMEFVSANAVIIRMRGLPYDCTDMQIKAFFEPLKMLDKILFISRSDGRPTGDAFVQFQSEEDATQALLKHRHTIGQRYIELFKSTAAEVQQVVKRCNSINNSTTTSSNASEHSDEKRKDCIRLRGLPYEAQVPNIVTFLGDYSKMVKYQGVHMIFNNQGNPSGEAFIQMVNEQAAAATALAVHNKFMVIGKKQRYIEVFQCSPEDLNLQHLVKPTQLAAPPPPNAAQTMAFMNGVHPPLFTQPQQQQFWSSYPSPPISPIVPGQLTQFVIYGIVPGIGIPELVAQFSSPEGIVENVIFTRMPTPICPGEAMITIRSRAPPPPPQLAHLHNYPFQQQQFLHHQQPIIMEQ